MTPLNLKELISKLNDTCRRSLEGAAGLCLSRTNYNVEIEHWLLKLLEVSNTDLAVLLRHYGVNTSRLSADLTKQIDRLKTGNARPPALNQSIVDLVREAWLLGTVNFGEQAVRSGHLLCALLSEETLMRVTSAASAEFEKISPEALRRDLPTLVAGTDEASQASQAVERTAAAGPVVAGKPGGPTKTPALDQFTIDLTARARRGDIDPVLGRDPEIRQIIDILTRRRQNNPILTGEAGVGKTAVVEGFALRVAAGDSPPALRNLSIRTLDLGLLQAGAGVRGEFENRLKTVIEEVKASPTPIILFIDEAHTMIGAGGQAGSGDAASLLKPALARGELRTIAATTWAEYKKYFEKDAALARRFQVVKVEEPNERSACEMLRGLVGTLEKHHQVRILEEGLTEAVRLSNRYISGRQLPDKAVSVLDTTCARIAISQSAVPPLIEDCRRRIQQLGVWIDILTREAATGRNHQLELAELGERKQTAEVELEQLQTRWEQEREGVAKIRQWRDQLEQGLPTAIDTDAQQPSPPPAEPAPPPLAPEERVRIQGELDATESQLKQLQGENPLVHVCVDAQAVAETVAGWTGIPLGRMVADEVRTVLNLKELMERTIVGQSHALDVIAQSIRTSR
ncbi:MAG: AAA family ATPase, partial [Planctomycetota bacterium]|nr:AAA family ATPase [Planctomycetota bacterium]